MRIAFDITALQNPAHCNRGIGYYVKYLLQNMLFSDKCNDYILFENNLYTQSQQNLIANPGQLTKIITPFYAKKNSPSAHLSNFLNPKEQIRLKNILAQSLFEQKINIYHIPSPFEDKTLSAIFPENIPTIITVHDIIPLALKKHYFSVYNQEHINHYLQVCKLIKQANTILAVSESTKNDLINYLDIPENKIEVISEGVHSRFKKLTNAEALQNIKQKFGLGQKFIMSPAGMEYRKNINRIIAAFAKLPRNILENYKLAIVCQINENEKKEINLLSKAYNIKDRIVTTDFVSDEEIVELYNAAECVLFPSLYEGFGFPVVEAMSCGTPVVTSNTSSMPEIAGDAGILINPYDTQAITNALVEVLNTPSLLVKMAEKGLQQAKKFTWEKAAIGTINAYEKLIKKTALKNKHSHKKIKLAYLSPLPPQKSGISDYSDELLSELSKHNQIDLYSDLKTTAKNLTQNPNISLFALDDFPKNAKNYHKVIYQIGNSNLHIKIYKLALQHPGIVILHDYVIAGMLNYDNATDKNSTILQDAFIAARKLDKSHPSLNKWQHNLSKDPATIYEYPLNEQLIQNSKEIVVHSYWAKNQILRRINTTKVRHIPMGTKINKVEADKINARKKLNLPKENFIFGVFGNVAYTKRIDVILPAFAELSQANKNVKLVIVGKIFPAHEPLFPDINKTIQKLGIADNVIITEYVGLQAFNLYLQAIDAAINLRYPSAGETSAALIKILAAGKPCIITAKNQFNEFPDSCCLKLDIESKHEASMLVKHMETLTTNITLFKQMEKNAYHYALSNHSLSKMVENYHLLIEDQSEIELINLKANNIFAEINDKIKHAIYNYDVSTLETTYDIDYSQNYEANNCTHRYTIHDLLKYDNEEFIVNAYDILLKRKPDLAGLNYHLNKLKQGTPKSIILSSMRFSTEGKKNSINIKGINFARIKECLYRLPVVSYLIQLLVALILLPKHQIQARCDKQFYHEQLKAGNAEIVSLRKEIKKLSREINFSDKN